jgi:glycolate oxidase FAD binding subunit
VRFVDGLGQIVKNGGRVMKNVTGYDLVKLMAGAWGTLGVLTEVSLKVLPDVADTATLELQGLSDAQAVQVMSAALGSPYEVTGAAHDATGKRTWLRIEGFADSVAYRADALSRTLAAYGTVDVHDAKASVPIWAAVRDVTALAGQPGDIWRLSVKPSDAADLVARLDARAVQYDWGGGLIWVLVPEGTDLRGHLSGVGGHATLIRATAETRAAIAPFQPEPAPLAAIATGLRAKFDPRGLLNPGLMT